MERRRVQPEDDHSRPGAGNGMCGADFEPFESYKYDNMPVILESDRRTQAAIDCGLPPDSTWARIAYYQTYGLDPGPG